MLLPNQSIMSKSFVTIWMILMIGGRISEASIKDIENACGNSDCPEGPYCFGFKDVEESEFTDCYENPKAETCTAFGAVREEGAKYKFQIAGKVARKSGYVGIGFGDITPVKSNSQFSGTLGIVCLVDDNDKTSSVRFVTNPPTKTVGAISGGSVSIEGGHIYCEFEINDKPHNGAVKLKDENYKIILFGNDKNGKLNSGNIEASTYIVGGDNLQTRNVFRMLKESTDRTVTTDARSSYLPGLTLIISAMGLSTALTYLFY